MVILLNQSVSEDMEASYPDSGSVNDSREGGPEESEEVEEGAGEGGQDSSFSEAPLPKHLGKVAGNHWGIVSGQGPICQYLVLMDSVCLLSWSELSKVFGWSKVPCLSPGLLSISATSSKVAPLLHPGKY